MKKHIISIIVLIAMVVVLIMKLFPNQDTGVEPVAAEPRALVIETPIDNPEPGTVTIITPYQDSESWTGLIYVDQNGDITVMDAVEIESEE